MSEKTLSLFIDESGDFGVYAPHSPYYIICIVLHDQSIDIHPDIKTFEQHLKNSGYPDHAVHTGPLIRRESVYLNDNIKDRKYLFNALFHFVRKLNIKYLCVKVKKSDFRNSMDLMVYISRELSALLNKNIDFFREYEKMIIYYDNGQNELTKIITSVFNSLYSFVEFRKVSPSDYRLFQAADLICTLELLSEKAASNTFTKSEIEFFNSIRNFKKSYMKYIEKKRIK